MRLKWGTADEPIIGNLASVDFETMIVSAPVVPDGDGHEYVIDLSRCKDWIGPGQRALVRGREQQPGRRGHRLDAFRVI